MTFPEFQRAGSNRCRSRKGEDAETMEGQLGNNSATLGRVLVPPQGKCIIVSLSSSAELNPFKMIVVMKHSLSQKEG